MNKLEREQLENVYNALSNGLRQIPQSNRRQVDYFAFEDFELAKNMLGDFLSTGTKNVDK